MGIDTKFYTNTNVSAENVMTALKTIGAANIKFEQTHTPSYIVINFTFQSELSDYGIEKRMLHFHTNYASEYTGLTGNLMSLGMWGSSVEIMERLAKMLGGMLVRNDSKEQEFEAFQAPGYGNLRFLLDKYYLENENTPRTSVEDMVGFTEYVKQYHENKGKK